MNNHFFLIGIDIGKSKISAGLFSDCEHLSDYVESASSSNASEIIETVHEQISRFVSVKKNAYGIGIGSFGVVDPGEGMVISSGSITGWNHIRLKQMLESRYHVPVFVDNDVNTAALGEYCTLTDTQRKCDLLFLSIGTSVGVGYVNNGLIHHGTHARFGEIAKYKPIHSLLPLEKLMGGRGVAGQYGEKTASTVTGKDVISLASHGDLIAKEIIDTMIDTTAHVLHYLDCVIDARHLRVGGSMICKNPVVFQKILARYAEIANANASTPVSAQLHEKSGVYGAAALVWKQTDHVLPYFQV